MDLSSLRISFIAGTLGQGGAERQLYYNLQALTELGADIQLLSLTNGEYWEQPIRQLGVKFAWVGKSQSKAERLREIINKIRMHKPSVVQSQHFYTNLYAAAAARILRIQDIGAIRNDGINEVAAVGPIWGRLSLRVPQRLAANSQTGISNVIAMGVNRSRVSFVPNVIDTMQFTPAERSWDRQFTILGIGRLVEQKRFDRFLRILCGLRSVTSREVKGVIIGSGPKRESLVKEARRLGLGSNDLKFPGALDDIRPALKQAQILLLTSDWEGTPNVVLEAMASGLPVVAMNAGGVSEIIRNGQTGFVVARGAEKEAVTILTNLTANATLCKMLSQNAREFINMNHSLSQLPTILSKLYATAHF
jgi:glycosyltransferase involved in cell wall biosynthesis